MRIVIDHPIVVVRNGISFICEYSSENEEKEESISVEDGIDEDYRSFNSSGIDSL